MNKKEEAKNYIVECRCGAKFNLIIAPWCEHVPTHTKLCPYGHCICHLLDDKEKWRKATEKEKQYEFEFMLKEEYGGIKGIKENAKI